MASDHNLDHHLDHDSHAQPQSGDILFNITESPSSFSSPDQQQHFSSPPSSRYAFAAPSQSSDPMNQWGGYQGGGVGGGGWRGDGAYGWADAQQRASLMSTVPPDLDPPVDTTSLDRKTCGFIQQEVAKWARDSKYTVSPEEGKPLLRPVRNLFLGLMGGTIAGRYLLGQFAPTVVQGPRTKAWLLGSIIGGYPLGWVTFYFSQLPSIKAVLEKKTPLGVQARYLLRVAQAEKSGMPPPPPPFGTYPMQQQPGMPGMASPWAQG